MYHEIAEKLIQAIQNQEYVDKLPTEMQLMARFNVSRNTIRRAIDLVYQRGILRRVQGSGYFVNQVQVESKATVNLSTGVGKNMLFAGGKLKSKIVTFDKVEAATIDLARALKVDPEEKLYRIIRLRYLHEQLYDFEEAYYTLSSVPFLTTEAINNSILSFVKETYGIEIVSSDDFITMTHLAPDQAELMHAPVGAARLELQQLSYSKNNVLFNFSRTIYAYPGLNFYFHSARLSSN